MKIPIKRFIWNFELIFPEGEKLVFEDVKIRFDKEWISKPDSLSLFFRSDLNDKVKKLLDDYDSWVQCVLNPGYVDLEVNKTYRIKYDPLSKNMIRVVGEDYLYRSRKPMEIWFEQPNTQPSPLSFQRIDCYGPCG